MKIGKTRLVIGAAMALSVALVGCGSTINSDPAVNAPVTGVSGSDVNGNEFVGSAKCIECHEDNANLGAAQVAAWKAGTHYTNFFPFVFEEDGRPQECLSCHDAVGDSLILEEFLAEGAAKVSARDLTPNEMAVVGCEACHGGGGQHYGKGPIPVGKPDYMSCGGANVATNGTSCHNDLGENEIAGFGGMADHSTYHPEAMSILPKYLESGHHEGSPRASTKCTRCHTDEGARAYVTITAPDTLSSAVHLAEWGAGSDIQCRTCHDAHQAGKLLRPETTGSTPGSSEYNTCTYCHQSATVKLTGDRWTDMPVSATSDGAMITASGTAQLIYHAGRWNRIIATTHYDDPATTADIEGMIVRIRVNGTLNERACRDCHDVHSADLTIQKQWALSGHAGEIAEAKETVAAAQEDLGNDDTVTMTKAVQAAYVEGELFAWPHYDWDSTLKKGTTNYETDRGQCQECHTATGFMNWANAMRNEATYDFTTNNFTHLSGWTKGSGVIGTSIATGTATTPSGQNELLYCWACHTDNQGALRNPGAVSLTKYPSSTSAAYTSFAQLPDVGSSNLCAKCHGGRNNNSGFATTSVGSRSTTRFSNHHAVTGGTLFAADTHIAFEFSGKSYTPVAYFKHDKIGLNTMGEGEAQTGAGPCVTCHMGQDADHTFNALGVDEEDEPIIKNLTTCNATGCHVDEYTMSYTKLEEEKAGFDQARQLLSDLVDNEVENVLDTAIVDNVVRKVSPYDSLDDTLAFNLYGAVQNKLLFFNDEPCAYVHNRKYAQRVIFDSINVLLDGELTQATLDLSAYPLAAAWMQGNTTTDDDNEVARP